MNPEPHLDEQVLFELHAGELSDARRAELLAHLEHCGRCQAERDLLEDFQSTDAAPLPELQRRRLWQAVQPARGTSRRRSPWWSRGLLAASIVVAMLGVRELLPPETSSHSTGELRSLAPRLDWNLRATATAGGWEIEWAAQPDVATYQLTVQAEDGRVLLDRRTEANHWSISRDELGLGAQSSALLVVGVRAVGQDQEASPLVALPVD